MNGLDLAIVAALTVCVYFGAKRGMAQEVLGVTGWLIAVLLAIRFGGMIAGLILQKVPTLPVRVAAILSFLLLLFATRILVQGFIQFFKKLFGSELHTKIDRFVGAVLGFIKGAFFVSVLTLMMQVLPLNERIQSIERESVLYPHMSGFARLMVDGVIRFVPQIQKPLQKGVERFNELKEAPTDPQPDRI